MRSCEKTHEWLTKTRSRTHTDFLSRFVKTFEKRTVKEMCSIDGWDVQERVHKSSWAVVQNYRPIISIISASPTTGQYVSDATSCSSTTSNALAMYCSYEIGKYKPYGRPISIVVPPPSKEDFPSFSNYSYQIWAPHFLFSHFRSFRSNAHHGLYVPLLCYRQLTDQYC